MLCHRKSRAVVAYASQITRVSQRYYNGHFAAEGLRGTNRPTGEQMTHWDILNKENSHLVAFFNISQCVICLPVWRFVPCDCSAAKGSFH